MLKFLRHKKTAKKIWIILAILIVPAFVLWGSGSLSRNKQPEAESVMRIFGRKIDSLEYQDAMDALRNQLIIQYGDDLSEIKKHMNLEAQVLERLILLAEAKKRKIKVSDQEVIELIESYPFFQKKGIFNNVIYNQTLQYVLHTQPRIFEEQTRQNMALFKLFKAVTDNVSINDEEIRLEYQKLNEELSIYYIAGVFTDFIKDILPSEEEIKKYFTDNSFQFKQPLSFNLEYVSLEILNKNSDAIAKDAIQKIISRLNRKENFLKITQDLKLTLKETGLFSQTEPIPGIGWSPQILNLLSNAKTGQFLTPIHADTSYYIMRVKERKESYIPDFAMIKDKVKEALIKNEAQEIAKSKIESCLAKLKETYKLNPKSVDFEKQAKEYGLKSNSTGLFKYGSYIEGIGSSDSFWMVANNLKDEEFSGVVTDTSGFYIIKLKSRLPLDEKKIEAEKEDFTRKVLLEKRQEYFLKFTEELKRKAVMF